MSDLSDFDSLSAQAVDYSSSIVEMHEDVELAVNVLVPQVRLYHSIVARVALWPHDETVVGDAVPRQPSLALGAVLGVSPCEDDEFVSASGNPERHTYTGDSLINVIDVVLARVVWASLAVRVCERTVEVERVRNWQARVGRVWLVDVRL